MVILGINAYHGDASAALVVDGRLVAAAEEERFSRIKHSAGFPTQAIKACLKIACLEVGDIDHVAVARDPRARLIKKALYAMRMPRLAWNRLGAHVKFAGINEELSKALGVEGSPRGVTSLTEVDATPTETNTLQGRELRAEVHRVEHHKAHLASSFFVSPFEEAALLSADGLGDFASTLWGVGRGKQITVEGGVTFPHSLGIFYTALTQYLGFWRYGDEYKVMGLAAYGEPEYRECLNDIVRLDGREGFSLGLDYFSHHKGGPEMTWREGEPVVGKLYGNGLLKKLGPERQPDSPIEQRHRNVAASLKARLEDAMLTLLNRLYEQTRIKNLCLAGGVAFNCVANGQIFDKTPFEKVYIQSAAGDSGLAIGAAFYLWHQILGRPRSFEMKHSYWGPEFGEDEIRKALRAKGMEQGAWSMAEKAKGEEHGEFRIVELAEEEVCRLTAERIAAGKIVGWFQGRMEWGPRALGNRSIVVDPRRAEMKEVLNKRIKRREPFRPFAPSILQERVGDYFEQSHPSPFMLMTYKVKPEKRSVIPAPSHVDGTGRLQTVSEEQNPLFWRLIVEFDRLTGVPVLLNTSFNENEPVVCTPEEALNCFLRTKMEVLGIGKYLVEKEREG
jgi:carbamoyltransferase